MTYAKNARQLPSKLQSDRLLGKVATGGLRNDQANTRAVADGWGHRLRRSRGPCPTAAHAAARPCISRLACEFEQRPGLRHYRSHRRHRRLGNSIPDCWLLWKSTKRVAFSIDGRILPFHERRRRKEFLKAVGNHVEFGHGNAPHCPMETHPRAKFDSKRACNGDNTAGPLTSMNSSKQGDNFSVVITMHYGST
jgi:hypothetical protein